MKYKGLLFFTAIIWGLAFAAQREGMAYCGPYEFNFIRFLLGALVVYAIGSIRSGKLFFISSKKNMLLAVGVGVIIFIAGTLQQVGLLYTTAGKSGFITGLYIIFVPVILFFAGRKINVNSIAGIFLAAIGMFLLSTKGNPVLVSGEPSMFGDIIELISAVFWAFHILAIDYLVKRMEPLSIAFIQFMVCALLSLVLVGLFEDFKVYSVLQNPWSLLYSGLLSVGIGFTLQVVAQKRVPPVTAVIIMSTETIFAVLGGWILLSETLNSLEFIGCGLMFVGMVIAQLRKPLNLMFTFYKRQKKIINKC